MKNENFDFFQQPIFCLTVSKSSNCFNRDIWEKCSLEVAQYKTEKEDPYTFKQSVIGNFFSSET